MKKIFIVALMTFSLTQIKAQHVRVMLNFPVGVNVNAPGPAPYPDAVWVGPEWEWRNGEYVHVPGYWSKPFKRNHRWECGRWKHTRRGYIWIPGRWR